MSYPYQQGSHQGMPGMPPYPQQQPPYPSNRAPYPPTSFNQPAPPPTQYATGFGFNAPTSMPMPGQNPPMGHGSPYPQNPPQNMPSYPQTTHSNMPSYPTGPQSSPYPSSGQPYPPNKPMGGAPSYMGGASSMGGPMGGASSMGGPMGSPYPQNPPMGGAPTPHNMPAYPSQHNSPYPQSSPMGGAPPNMGGPPMTTPSFGQNAPYGNSSAPSGPMYPNLQAQSANYGNLGSAPPTHGAKPNHNKPGMPVKFSPTVLPAEPFNPRADAEVLRKAMKGFGTDEKAIIQVLANRPNAQRLEIAVQFKTLYGKDLIKDLKSELSGRFEDLVVAMMTPLPQFYAKEIHEALSGVGTDEDTLIEVFCTMSNNEIRIIRAAYETMYHSSLESDLSGDTSGTFRRLMVSLCTANRDESMHVDQGQVQADAQALLRAGEMRLGTDESTFNAILCQRNFSHLRCVFEQYQQITGHDFEKAIKNEFSGDAEEGLLAIVRSIKDRALFFATRLHQSMKGMGTNDKQLIRLVVMRSEVDMGEIKNAYQSKYGHALADDISGDCSGDYKKCLLALINI